MNISMIQSLQESMDILNSSLVRIEEWKCDTENLEEILRNNHRGWELLLKTFQSHFTNIPFKRNHKIIEIISLLEKENKLNFPKQNMQKLFFSENYQDYFKLLDRLVDTKSRYRNLNDLIGEESAHYEIDKWIKNHIGYIDKKTFNINYDKIRNDIIKINYVSIRFIAMNFSCSNDSETIQLSSVFDGKYYGYFTNEFYN